MYTCINERINDGEKIPVSFQQCNMCKWWSTFSESYFDYLGRQARNIGFESLCRGGGADSPKILDNKQHEEKNNIVLWLEGGGAGKQLHGDSIFYM